MIWEVTDEQSKKIEELIEDCNRKFYQTIDFGKVRIKGNFNSDHHLSHLKFMGKLEGAKVLDLGSNLGAVCLFALQKGATMVTGLEKNPYHASKAHRLRDILDIPYHKYILLVEDFENVLRSLGSQDIIFAFSIAHHLKRMRSTLELIAERTRNMLVLEVVIKAEDDPKRVEEVANFGKSFTCYPSEEAFMNFFEDKFSKIIVDRSPKARNRKIFYLIK